MRQKPFKFFFTMSMGIMVFLFLARFAIAAFVIAAILSVSYMIGRKLFHFFRGLDWKEQRQRPTVPVWKDGLLIEYPNQSPAYRKDKWVIEVR